MCTSVLTLKGQAMSQTPSTDREPKRMRDSNDMVWPQLPLTPRRRVGWLFSVPKGTWASLPPVAALHPGQLEVACPPNTRFLVAGTLMPDQWKVP
jgi:hypothetical protein